MNTNPTHKLHIIAIGASAGGLEALQKFLSHLPELKNTCVIVAQHLSPTHKSMLVQLLSKKTKLSVAEAENNKTLESNKVYITPPGKEISVKNNKIILQKPGSAIGPKPSVDVLFKSLAQNKNSNVIAIVLSGTGSDGAAGITALKEVECYIIVQEPETAKYDGMPVSAIQTGMTDAVLPPEKMGEEIHRYLNTDMRKKIKKDSIEKETSAIDKILYLLGKYSDADFSNYKSATIGRRLEKRMNALGIGSIEAYLKLLEKKPDEADEMFKTILIGVTTFFRDKEAFKALEAYLKKIINKKGKQEPIRIWVPGCSTGEEPYSIAILLSKILKDKIQDYKIQIFATDIDERAISKARKGIYPEASLENLSKSIREKYFIKKNNEFELIKAIRGMVLFSRHDIIKNPPFLKIDLISCRNLLIYFNTALQKQIIPVFHYSLNPESYLFLGKSETVGQFNNLFSSVDTKNKIFKRKSGRSFHKIKLSNYKARKQEIYPDKKTVKEENQLSLQEKVKETLFNTYEHPYVVVDENHDIQEVNGDVRLFLTLSPGSIQVNLIKMANPELQIELRSVLSKAIKERNTIKSNIKRFKLFDALHFVRITAQPLIYTESTENYFIVIFEKLDIERYVSTGKAENTDGLVNMRIQELEDELGITKEHLQTYIEEIETSNEELQSLNE
ncbi:MAG: chemotaxis protein CheB, partial [Chitinophagales bacterium]